jgi:cytochrome c oxidase assembly factor CtaG
MPSVAQAVLSSWSIPPWATFGLLLTAAIYFRGWRSLRSLRSSLFPSWRLACFLAGLAWLWFAIASPLDAFGGLVLTAHMVQHLLLMVVAPPLILLGSPAIPLLRGLPRWAARDALGPFLNWPLLERLGQALTHPAFCWVAMAVAMLGWHVPAAYELALRSPGWHQVEHACFFITSLLFWWPVIQPWPSASQWPRWVIPLYLLLGDVVNTILSAFLCFSNRILYPTYITAPHIFDLAPLDDQVAAGAIMWFVGSLAFLGPAVMLTVQLLSPPPPALEPTIPDPLRSSERRSAHTRFDLLRAPGVGGLLRARYGRRALQSVLLVLALAVIADGLFGPRMSSMNLAGVLPWTYGRGLVIIALLAAGNFFCMACPFMLPRELGRRLGFATHRWPRALRTKWLAVGLLVLFFWAFEAFDLWNTPLWTAWIVVAYFAAAFLVDTFFRGASFCKYVCPIGQFHFVSSLVSPLEVKVRSREVCTKCVTHDCLRGNERQRGCELHLFLPRKVGSMDCTFCLDCVKACPHDNIGILPTAPGRDLVRDPARSSLGRFSHRPDIAALALVLAFSAFASAAAMVAPVAAWRDRLAERFSTGSVPATSLFFLVALVLAPPLMVGLAVAIGRSLGRVARSQTLQSPLRAPEPSGDRAPAREMFCRFSLALVPLGLAMWGAHVLFHLLAGWNMPWPALQRATIDLGLGWLGRPHWVMSRPLLAADTLIALQLLLLDAGLLLTLYVGWRVANAFTPRIWASLRLFAPWAAVATGLYASGIWVLLQPMQMRGMVQ